MSRSPQIPWGQPGNESPELTGAKGSWQVAPRYACTDLTNAITRAAGVQVDAENTSPLEPRLL